jgi:16S rRNA (adenine1518-N6/adenine1519-N6)-dimethyltransferase
MFELEAKKSLGQNFLKNTSIIEKIVEAGEIGVGDIILEIGPGTGAMTEVILRHIDALEKGSEAKLIAIEKDSRAISILEAKFKAYIEKGMLQVIEGDFLEMNIGKILKKPYKIIANIPYYITGAIIRKALEDQTKPKTAIFLVQKEVAERITRKEESGSGKIGRIKSNILAESISAFGTAEYLFTVAKGNFVPMPKVDSAAIRISEISNTRFETSGVSEEAFFKIMKAGFSHKRKKAISNLKEYFEKKQLEDIFLHEGINIDARAEEINTDTWFVIAKKLKSAIE